MATFIHNMLGQDLNEIHGIIRADKAMRQQRHDHQQAQAQEQEQTSEERLEQMPFVETEVKEEKRNGEELEERKANDIFTKTSTSEFMKAPRPEADERISEGQNEIELQLAARSNYTRPFTNKISVIQKPLPEPRIKVEVPGHNLVKIH